MKIRYAVYLAGSMHGRRVKEVLRERAEAKEICRKLCLSYYDPADDEGLEHLSPDSIIDLKPNLRLMKSYVDKDDRHVDRSKYLLVLTGDKSSSGTAWEMARHYYRNRRPIVLVGPRQYDGLLTNFTTIKAEKICATLKQALTYIKRRIK